MPSNLFVIGAARSGTTIVTAMLNSSRDICLLGEANLHYRWETKAFVHSFNSQHHEAKRLISRGTFLPKAWIGLTAREALDELGKTFAIVGSKIAFPPFRDMPNSWAQDDAMNFHMQHFYGAQYLFLFREPLTCCLSTRKLFPKVTSNDIMASWLRSLAFLVLGAQTFPNHWMVPTAWIDATLLHQIETLLRKQLYANADWLVPPSTTLTTPEDGRGAEFCDSLVMTADSNVTGRQAMEAATEIYTRVVGWIDRSSLRFRLRDSAIAAIEKGVMVTLRQLMWSLAGTTLRARNFFAMPDNLLADVWQRGALSVERRVQEDGDGPPVFVLREQRDQQHKHIMQRMSLAVDQPITFSVEVRPAHRGRCALQIGQPGGHSLAIFDLSACALRLIHDGMGVLVLDARCRMLENGWISCDFSCQPTITVGYFDVSLYLIDDTDCFDFPGSGNDGIQYEIPGSKRSPGQSCRAARAMNMKLAQDCLPAAVEALANASLPVVIGPDGQCRISNEVREGYPKVVVISVPKSGTHFTGELLFDLGFRFAGLHLSPESLPDTLEDRRRLVRERLICPAQKRNCIPLKSSVPLWVVSGLIGPGQYLQGHVPYSETAAEGLRDVRIVYVERNPRDLAISSMRFVEKLHHDGHKFEDFLETDWIPMKSGPEKIIGYLDSFGRGVPKLLSEISPWKREPNAFTLRFDAIVRGDSAGSLAAIRNLAAFLDISIDDNRAQSIRDACVGRPTRTWSGKLSDWRDVWSDEVEAKFEEIGAGAFADPDGSCQ